MMDTRFVALVAMGSVVPADPEVTIERNTVPAAPARFLGNGHENEDR